MNSSLPDNQRPPPRSNTLAPTSGRPAARPISQALEPRGTPVRHVSFDSTTFSRLDPTVKRFKLGDGTQQARARERNYIEITDDENSLQDSRQSGAEGAVHWRQSFPRLHGAGSKRIRSPASQFNQPSEPVSVKPYVLDVPKKAPRYANKKPADFYPWTGNQPEDTLNPQTIGSGYFDKPATPSNESSPARPTIWSNMKHKSGLHMLSSLYVTTLKQRQKFGAVSTASTFKPPPRATLTEPKREVWLRDLADSEVPLRRLSRTIPHGIRGKTLLDQCMAKRIPVERALWLVKCVGANEIRAFKRKGPNAFAPDSEAKWGREWAMNVEEFLDALIETCGSDDWQENAEYGLKLLSHVYKGGILDEEHFLNWIVSSVKAALIHKLPACMLIMQMYWDEMVKYRTFGKNLALALCEQARKLYTQEPEVTQPISEILAEQIRIFISTSPSCFFWPSHWPAYADVLGTILQYNKEAFQSLQKRNEDAAIFACLPSIKDEQQLLVDILDHQNAFRDIKQTSKRCLATSSDINLVAVMLCTWATTQYRYCVSNSGLYLALRLLRRWSKARLNLEFMLFSFLRSCSDRLDLHKEKLYRLVSELLRSNHISIARYLQWIMAQGEPKILEVDLLRNLPLHRIPDHARNLCYMITGPSLPQSSQVSDLQISLKHRLFRDAMVDDEFDVRRIDTLSLAERYELSQWLRGHLFDHVDNDGELNNIQDLMLLSRILETSQDYAVLADVLSLYMEIGDIPLLDSTLRIANTYFEILHGIGAAEDLCQTALLRMEEVQLRSPAQKPLLMSLRDLVRRLPRRKKTYLVLQKELALCEPKSAVAACSPVPDTMGDLQEDGTFFEKIELLFNTGTSMDKPLITRIFKDIVKRLEVSWSDDILTSESLVEFLLKLRTFNGGVFASLFVSWLDSLLDGRKGIKVILRILLAGEVLKLHELYTRLVMDEEQSKAIPTNTLIDLTELLLTSPQSSITSRRYRVVDQINLAVHQHPSTLARFVVLTADRAGPDICSKPGFKRLLTQLSVHDDALEALCRGTEPACLADIVLAVPVGEDFINVLPKILCYFNSGICTRKLKKILDDAPDTDLSGLPQSAIRNIVAHTDCKTTPWTAIMKYLPRTTQSVLHRDLISIFLEQPSTLTEESHQSLFSLLSTVDHNLVPRDLLPAITVLSNNFNDLYSSISLTTAYTDTAIGSIEGRLTMLLRLLSIHMVVLSQIEIPPTMMQHLVLVLSSLYSSLSFNKAINVKLPLLDTLTFISDNLSPETREQISSILQTRNIASPELYFLFGPPSQSGSDPSLRLFPPPVSTERAQGKASARIAAKAGNSTIEAMQAGSTPRMNTKSGNSSIETLQAKGVPPNQGNPSLEQKQQPATLSNISNGAPFTVNKWEMVQDATPTIGDNDTSLSLSLFGARKAVM